MPKDKRIVKWVEEKQPTELEKYLFPGENWNRKNKHFKGEVLDMVMGTWEDYYVVHCTDGKVRRVNVKLVKEVKDGTV